MPTCAGFILQRKRVEVLCITNIVRTRCILSEYTDCFSADGWDAVLCPDPLTCAENCALDGAEYSSAYGITTSGNSIKLEFETLNTADTNLGSRLYLLANDTEYQIFNPLNMEIAFDVDVSNLPCGFNGALYFSEMDADGGLSKFPTNKAGAQYGTGYCDAQCPRDLQFINGQVRKVFANFIQSRN